MADSVLQIIIKGIDSGATGTLESVLSSTLGLSEGATKLGAAFLETTAITMTAVEAFKLVKEAITGSADAASKWETQLVEIANNTNMSTAAMGQMGQAVQGLAASTGGNMDQIAQGFMHAQNVTQDYNASLAITKVATESAISTGANATTVTNLLANAMHEYGIDTDTGAQATGKFGSTLDAANQTMGAMHLATAESNTELGAFVDATAKAVGIAANLGVSMNDVFAATSALTRHGFPDVNQAGTQVVDMLTHMMNPSVASKEALLALADASGDKGVASAFTAASLQSNGLVGTLNLLKKAMDDAGMSAADQEAEMNKLVPALRGGLGAAALTGTANSDLNKTTADLNDTTKTATVTQDSFARTLDTTAGQANILHANLGNLAQVIGGELNESAKSFLTTLNSNISDFQKWGDAIGAFVQSANDDSNAQLAWVASTGAIGSAIAATTENLLGQHDALISTTTAIDGANQALKESTGDFQQWGIGATEAGKAVVAAARDAKQALDEETASQAATTAQANKQANDTLQSDHDTSAQSPSTYVTDALAAANKAAFDTALGQAKTFYSDQAKTATDAATAAKDAASAANQATLDSTKAEIDSEKTAYDDRMAQDIKDRQNQTQAALASLQAQETAANAAAAAANTAAGVQAQAANTAEGVKQAAIQKTADESDTAWKAQVGAIKDAATSGENALHTSNDAILKDATTTANTTYATQVAAVDSAVKAREEGDARDIHSHELATAANIAGIEREKTAALKAIDEETAAYAAQEAARVKQIDATLSASVKGLNDQLAAEQRANTERLAVNSITKASGSQAGQELGQFFTASDAATADTEAAIAAKQAGNAALAQQDSAAAAQQQATAQALSAQLSQIDQATADQMVAYKLQSDSTITADQVAALTDQATNQKQALADQLAAEKQSQADKKTATSAHYDDEKAQATAALESYKWNMAQSLQAFKDEKAQEKTDDKAALDLKLTNIATQQTAENTRHADAISKINAQAATDIAAIDALAQARKDEYTAETARRAAAYAAATAARNADYTAQTAARQAQALADQASIKATGDADVLALQTSQKEADKDFPLRTKAAEDHYKIMQGEIDTTYKQDVNAIQDGLKEHNDALDARKNHMDEYTRLTNISWQTLINDANTYNAALAGQVAQQTALNQAQAAHQNATHSGAATGTGGGQGAPRSFASAPGPDGHNTEMGMAALARANAFVGVHSGEYYRDGDTWCEQFAEDVTGLPNMGDTARHAWDNWGAKQLPGQTFPGPELLYFDGPTAAGHVMVGSGTDGVSVLDPRWGIVDESVSKFLTDNPGASFLGSVPLYAEGGVVPGPWGQPMPAIVHGGEEFLGLQGQRGTLADRGERIDYERLAQAVVTALRASPPVIAMDGRVVSDLLQTSLRRKLRANPTLGLGQ